MVSGLMVSCMGVRIDSRCEDPQGRPDPDCPGEFAPAEKAGASICLFYCLLIQRATHERFEHHVLKSLICFILSNPKMIVEYSKRPMFFISLQHPRIFCQSVGH